MAYWYYVMCHNLKPFTLDDEDPLSIILKTFFLETFFICHMMSLYKLLIFMVIYTWHIIIYRW